MIGKEVESLRISILNAELSRPGVNKSWSDFLASEYHNWTWTS